jgi:hypothetical protein
VFDSKRSEHYFVEKSLSLYIPENINPRGLKEPWAVFKFNDCMEVFRKDERAWSQDRLIAGRRINFAELFVMKPFYNEIVKMGHAGDPYFDQMYQDKIQAFIQSKDSQNNISEFLYRLYNPR